MPFISGSALSLHRQWSPTSFADVTGCVVCETVSVMTSTLTLDDAHKLVASNTTVTLETLAWSPRWSGPWSIGLVPVRADAAQAMVAKARRGRRKSASPLWRAQIIIVGSPFS